MDRLASRGRTNSRPAFEADAGHFGGRGGCARGRRCRSPDIAPQNLHPEWLELKCWICFIRLHDDHWIPAGSDPDNRGSECGSDHSDDPSPPRSSSRSSAGPQAGVGCQAPCPQATPSHRLTIVGPFRALPDHDLVGRQMVPVSIAYPALRRTPLPSTTVWTDGVWAHVNRCAVPFIIKRTD